MLTAAIMFIFLGVPLTLCLAAIPFVMFLLYIVVYISYYAKATEILTSKRPLKTWIAEAYLPYFFTRNPRDCSFEIVRERDNLNLTGYQKQVSVFIVFVAICLFLFL